VVPVQTYGDSPFAGALGLRVRRAGGISQVGRISHPGRPEIVAQGSPIRRSLVVGDTVFTVSDAGVKASALSSLADLGFARLPEG
jgi:Beta propeller domain